MKKLLFVFLAFVPIICYGFIPNRPQPHSKEQAIAILKVTSFVDMFRYLDDVPANIDRLIDEIEKIVAVDQATKARLKSTILSTIQQRTPAYYKPLVFWQWNWADPSFIELDVDEIIKENFNSSDYERISAQLTINLNLAIDAYRYLIKFRNKELNGEEYPIIGPVTAPENINLVYDYFDI